MGYGTRTLQTALLVCAVAAPGASRAADIVLAPPAAGGVAITNAAGSVTRFRVGEDGIFTLPTLAAVPGTATGLCMEIATGKVGTCSIGTLSSLVAGTGLTGGTITTTGTVALAAGYQLPQSCTSGQLPASNGAGGWACTTPALAGDLAGTLAAASVVKLAGTPLSTTRPTGAGQVLTFDGTAAIWAAAPTGGATNIATGTGLTGGPITGTGTISLAAGYQLPQACTNGQVPTSNGSGGWTCAMPAAQFGTGTSAITSQGTTSSGTCTVGEVKLVAGVRNEGATLPAAGQLLPIASYSALFSLVGINYGGNGTTNFALPDLRSAAPNGLTYVICVTGTFPT